MIRAAVWAVALALVAPAAGASTPRVLVERGQAVQIAVATDLSGFGSEIGEGVTNAVRMAMEGKSVRGFPIKLNVFDAPCGRPDAAVDAARNIVANGQHVAVIGHLCSVGFDEALPIYERSLVTTLSGSATADWLPAYGPRVFNRTAVSDGHGFEEWYAAVTALPRNEEWQERYAERFGMEAPELTDLYYDAAQLLLRRLQTTSRIGVGRRLVINRAALARAVRATTRYEGVTCVVAFDPSTGNRVNDPTALQACATG